MLDAALTFGNLGPVPANPTYRLQLAGAAVSDVELILDRPLDEEGNPIGGPVIINPDAPEAEQRYLLKELETGTGTPLPSIGIMIEF